MGRKNKVLRVLMCMAAGLIMSFNIRSFVRSGDLLPGGFSGLSILIQNIFGRLLGISIPYGPIYVLLNIFPVILSFRKIGKRFTVYSCITIAIVAFLTDFIPVFEITSDVLLISVFGGLINGIAVSLCLNAGATSGGTDFISIYFSEKFKIETWNYILLFNVFVLVCDGFLFGWDKAMYSLIAYFVIAKMIDVVLKGIDESYAVMIVTSEHKKVSEALLHRLGRGVTMLHGAGGFSGIDKEILYSVVTRLELRKLKEVVLEEDPSAFLTINAVSDIVGGRVRKKAIH